MSKWRPIETAPILEEILLFSPRYGVFVSQTHIRPFWLACRDKDFEITSEWVKPTHWMPIPTPPDLPPVA